MKLKAMTFSGEVNEDDNPVPESVTVEMSLREVVAIAKVFGSLNGRAQKRLGLADSGIYDCLTGDVINRFWDSGLDSFGPRVNPATINNEEGA